jgi:hypothetical protein
MAIITGDLNDTLVASPIAAQEGEGDTLASAPRVTLRVDPDAEPSFISPPEQFLRTRNLVEGDSVPNPIQSSSFAVNYDANFLANPAAQAAFQFAVDIWDSLIDTPQPVVIDADFVALGPGVLGSAGANFIHRNFTNAPVANTWYPDALANQISGSDLNPDVDINADFSSTFNFYFGTDGNPGFGQFDFVSVVLHEIGHGLGFFGFGRDAGGGQGAIDFFGSPGIYDTFVENGSGTSILSFADPSAALLTQFTGGDLFIDAPLTTAANGGNPAEIFTPNPFQGGSSYSHWDELTFNGTPNSLMTPQIGAQEVIHDPGPLTLALFQDMGYEVKGLITVVKDATPADGTNFSFTSTIPGAANFSLDDDGGTFNVDDDGDGGGIDESRTFNPVVGTYTVAEAALGGFSLDNIVITGDTDGGSSVNTITRTATIDLDSGEDITVTFNNSVIAPTTGTIIVVKDAVPADGTDFDFTSDIPGGASFTLDDASPDDADGIDEAITFSNVASGTYSVTESLPSGFSLDSIGFSGDGDAGSSGNTMTGVASIDLDPGETITVTYTNSEDSLIFDIDGDGSFSAFTDAILIARYAFGFTGSVLTDGALGGGATRTDPVDIENYLDSVTTMTLSPSMDLIFDIDADGSFSAFTDSILIARYAFGFTGSVLTDGALGGGATRTDPVDIENYLDTVTALTI